MNKKLTLLLVAVMVLCLFCAVGCEIPDLHEHNYVEVAAKQPTCTEDGNALYYTCSGCEKLFDADKNEISAIPSIESNGHAYHEHAAVDVSCVENGCALYYSCDNCEAIFDAEKNVITSVPVIESDGHAYAWTKTENGIEYKCTACNDVKHTVNEAVADRQILDAGKQSVTLDLSSIGEVTAKSVTLGDAVVENVTVEGATVTFAPDALNAEHGEQTLYVSVTVGDSNPVTVSVPVLVAYTVNNLDDLRALYTNSENASYVGGTVETVGEGDEAKEQITARYYYVLTVDINGENRDGIKATYMDEAETSNATLGAYKQGFIGVFDGCGHTISGIEINTHGIFGHIGRATIQNVTFDNITLADGETSVLGKAMDSTIKNVTIKNVQVGKRSEVAGVVFYHQAFSVELDNVTIDLSSSDAEGANVFAKMLDNSEMWEFDNSTFTYVNVTVKHTFGNLFENIALTDSVNGVKVSFVDFSIEKPIIEKDEFYYTGHEIVVPIAESPYYTVTGNKATDIGSYNITVSLNFDGITWTDSTTEAYKPSWSIIELPDDEAKQIAAEFCSKVAALASAEFPRDKASVDALASEYESLHDKVKAADGVADAKAALDELKVVADKYSVLEVEFIDRVRTALLTHEQYWFSIKNDTDSDISVFIGGPTTEKSWDQTSAVSVPANSIGYIDYPVVYAEKGNIYIYVNGADINSSSGYELVFYGYYDESATASKVKVITDLIDVINLDNLSVESATEVEAARTAYASAAAFVQRKVPSDKLDVLTTAESKLAALIVTESINSLAEMDVEGIYAARAGYDALTDEQKAFVSEQTLAKLVALEAMLTPENIANAFAAKVTNLGTPSYPRDIMLIGQLVAEYNALSDEAKAYLADTKATLDGYVEECDKWEDLAYEYTGKIETTFSGYDAYYLVIYNPTDSGASFSYSGDFDGWASSYGACTLAAKAYTQISYVEIAASKGQAYCYIGGDNKLLMDATNGWIMKVYGKKITGGGVTVTALSVKGATETQINGESHTVLSTDVKRYTVEDWGTDPGGYFIAWGTMSREQIESLAKYDNVYFYIYNPNEENVQFFFQDNKDWVAHDSTTLAAKSWTKVSLKQVLDLPEAATMVYVDVDHNNHENFVYEGWMISDFYGIA